MISGPNPRQLFEVLIVLKVFKSMSVTVIQTPSKAMGSSKRHRPTNEKPGGKTPRNARKPPKSRREIEPQDRVRARDSLDDAAGTSSQLEPSSTKARLAARGPEEAARDYEEEVEFEEEEDGEDDQDGEEEDGEEEDGEDEEEDGEEDGDSRMATRIKRTATRLEDGEEDGDLNISGEAERSGKRKLHTLLARCPPNAKSPAASKKMHSPNPSPVGLKPAFPRLPAPATPPTIQVSPIVVHVCFSVLKSYSLQHAPPTGQPAPAAPPTPQNPTDDCPIQGNRASHALAAQLMPMIFAAGLGTSYSESESKAARNKLLVQVIKGGNVLNLLDVIDTYPARIPNGMVRLDKNLLTLFAGADKVLTKPLLSL